jgi:hypothetical protein
MLIMMEVCRLLSLTTCYFVLDLRFILLYIYILIHVADASDAVDHNVDDNDIVQVEED